MNKKIIKALYIFIITSMLFSGSVNALEYKDVPHGYWAYKSIDKLTNENIISGYSKDLFKPDAYVTRAQYAAMVIKAIKQEDIKVETMYTFDDIDSSNWAWQYVLRALNLDILKPCSENNFCPNDYITRSEVITFLVNLLRTEDITKKEAIVALQNAYDDFDEIPDWFKPTAGKAEVINVIAKVPGRERYLDYDKYVTRAQIATFLANMKREIESYEEQQFKEDTSPKIAEGIIIENVIQNGDVVTIPQKAVLPIMITGQISSKNTLPGQMFQARFANNIVDNKHQLLFSKDIILIGKVLSSVHGITFLRNGEIMFELSAANNQDLLTSIFGYAEYKAAEVESGKLKKTATTVFKGRNFTAKDGQILYITLFKPIRVNIVTGEVLD